jgi:DNA-binding transcriptional MerR regulator
MFPGIVDPMSDPGALTVEDLAVRAGLPVRTIREYQTMRVLDPPQRRGRVGYYGQAHLRRLELIGRLQDRGYSLAGIRDLVDAWAAGQDLASMLAGPDGALAEEGSVVVDASGLAAALPHLPELRIADLEACGVAIDQGAGTYCVPSPSLLALLDDALASGVPAADAFAVARAITAGTRRIAGDVAATLAGALGDRAEDEAVARLARRGRVLIAQAASRLLLHELGADPRLAGLVESARRAPHGE